MIDFLGPFREEKKKVTRRMEVRGDYGDV